MIPAHLVVPFFIAVFLLERGVSCILFYRVLARKNRALKLATDRLRASERSLDSTKDQLQVVIAELEETRRFLRISATSRALSEGFEDLNKLLQEATYHGYPDRYTRERKL
jgi:hypothetical protein